MVNSGGGGASLPASCPDARKRRVSYFYEPTIGDYYYGQGHPMKPHRIRMAHNLIVHYSLHRRMEISRPFPAASADILRFHSPDYVDFLSSVTPDTLLDHTHSRQLKRFNVGEDCPVFDGLFSFCQASAGGSIGAAVKLNRQDADIAINWAGGLHHAKKSEASGFCYVNDIVLGILELLKAHRRVLYIDIDIHHGDGVEEAFYVTDRVMTVSFHKFGDFFPGTGHIKDIGVAAGKNYALNVPLNDGLNDQNFQSLFRPVIQKVMEVYQPDVVVLQCGADSLAGDRLGCFNLSVKGHADCLRFLRSFNVPLMVLGGGGYTIRNVARCWCYETAVAVDIEPDNKLPYNDYYEYFGPDYTLHVEPSPVENLNTDRDLEKMRNMLLDQLSKLEHVPSVPFQVMPPTTEVPEEREEDMEVRETPVYGMVNWIMSLKVMRMRILCRKFEYTVLYMKQMMYENLEKKNQKSGRPDINRKVKEKLIKPSIVVSRGQVYSIHMLISLSLMSSNVLVAACSKFDVTRGYLHGGWCPS